MRQVLQKRIRHFNNERTHINLKKVKEGYSSLITIFVNSILYTQYVINQLSNKARIGYYDDVRGADKDVELGRQYRSFNDIAVEYYRQSHALFDTYKNSYLQHWLYVH